MVISISSIDWLADWLGNLLSFFHLFFFFFIRKSPTSAMCGERCSSSSSSSSSSAVPTGHKWRRKKAQHKSIKVASSSSSVYIECPPPPPEWKTMAAVDIAEMLHFQTTAAVAAGKTVATKVIELRLTVPQTAAFGQNLRGRKGTGNRRGRWRRRRWRRRGDDNNQDHGRRTLPFSTKMFIEMKSQSLDHQKPLLPPKK